MTANGMLIKLTIIVWILGTVTSGKVTFTATWPAGRESFAGAKGYFLFSELFTGTCTIILPLPVPLFVGENFDIVPDKSDRYRGKYVITAPYRVYYEKMFKFILRFSPGQYFPAEAIEWWCDVSQESSIGVGSFPTEMTQTHAFSHIWMPDLRRRSQLTLYFPQPVADFKAYGADRTIKRSSYAYKLSGFRFGQDEIWFQFRYLTKRRFDATEIAVKEKHPVY